MFGANRVEQRNLARRNEQARLSHSIYQSRIASENIINMSLQNEALRASIRAMGGSVPGQSVAISTGGGGGSYSQAFEQLKQTPGVSIGGNARASSDGDFPSLAQIQSMIESSQKKAEEDFMGKVNLLKNQEQQRQEEDQLSARNAASRMQSYQRQSAIGAWESALKGR